MRCRQDEACCLTWILATHFPVDINVHGAHNQRRQCCEDDIVQRHVEVCTINQEHSEAVMLCSRIQAVLLPVLLCLYAVVMHYLASQVCEWSKHTSSRACEMHTTSPVDGLARALSLVARQQTELACLSKLDSSVCLSMIVQLAYDTHV